MACDYIKEQKYAMHVTHVHTK